MYIIYRNYRIFVQRLEFLWHAEPGDFWYIWLGYKRRWYFAYWGDSASITVDFILPQFFIYPLPCTSMLHTSYEEFDIGVSGGTRNTYDLGLPLQIIALLVSNHPSCTFCGSTRPLKSFLRHNTIWQAASIQQIKTTFMRPEWATCPLWHGRLHGEAGRFTWTTSQSS